MPARWLLKTQLWYLMAMALSLSACSTAGTSRVLGLGPGSYPPAVYTHRVGSANVDIYWNCAQPEPGVLEMDGVVWNTGGRTVNFMKLNLVGADSHGGTVSQATTSLPDIALGINQISPFHMRVRTVGSEVRFDLYYEYYPGTEFGFSHRNFVRDACSPTQHLVR
jgi:putative hemolysin